MNHVSAAGHNLNLSTQYRKLMEITKDVMDRFDWENKTAYAHWLAQSHYFVCHSTRLLASAGARVAVGNEMLHKRMVAHIGEEIGHEKIAVNDIREMGLSIQDHPEFAETKAFYQSQYFWIEHRAPIALMGYILFLEGLSITAGPGIYERISKAHGPKASVFLKVHATEDLDHVDEAFEALQNITPMEESYIVENMKQSAQVYFLILSKCQEMAERKMMPATQDRSSDPLLWYSEALTTSAAS